MRDMREILFRGKRVDNGEWAYGYVFDDGIVGSKRMFIGGLVITDSDGKTDSRYEVGVDFHEVISETRGEYNGLTDKNGVKVFEGDILRFTTTDKAVKWLCTVEFYEGGFIARQIKHKASYKFFDCGNRLTAQWESVGNIHDNPDFLEVGEE